MIFGRVPAFSVIVSGFARLSVAQAGPGLPLQGDRRFTLAFGDTSPFHFSPSRGVVLDREGELIVINLPTFITPGRLWR